VVEPRALLWLDGRTRQATAYLQPNDERRRRHIERMYGDGLVPVDDAARKTGLDAGYENVSASVPIEIDEIERTMQEPGLRRR